MAGVNVLFSKLLIAWDLRDLYGIKEHRVAVGHTALLSVRDPEILKRYSATTTAVQTAKNNYGTILGNASLLILVIKSLA